MLMSMSDVKKQKHQINFFSSHFVRFISSRPRSMFFTRFALLRLFPPKFLILNFQKKNRKQQKDMKIKRNEHWRSKQRDFSRLQFNSSHKQITLLKHTRDSFKENGKQFFKISHRERDLIP